MATWCPVCDKRVSNKGKDTNGLLAHIRKFHPKRSNQYLLQVNNFFFLKNNEFYLIFFELYRFD